MSFKAEVDYDFTKNIEGLSINTSFIPGLERIIGYFIVNVIENPSELPKMFDKFTKIITQQDENIELTHIESLMYTLFSLQQYFKYEANRQGLEIKIDKEIDPDEIKKYVDSVYKGDLESAEKKLNEIQDLLESAKKDSLQDNQQDHK